MLLVLDTTEFYDNLFLDSADFAIFLEYVQRHHPVVRLIVPKIVVEETVNHYRKCVRETLASLSKSIRSANKYVYDLPDLASQVPTDIDTIVNRYAVEDLQKLLNRYSAEQPGYDKLGMNTIVERALARRQPFDNAGQKGFRDVLLWESVLAVIIANPTKTVLITTNTNDFGRHGELAVGLRFDLEACGLKDLDVSVCNGIGVFVKEHVKPELEHLNGIRDQIEAGSYPEFSASQFFEDTHSEICESVRDSLAMLPLQHSAFERFRLVSLDRRPERVAITNVWKIDDQRLAIELYYTVGGELRAKRSAQGSEIDQYESGRVSFNLPFEVLLEEVGDGSWQMDPHIDVSWDDWAGRR